MKLLIDKYPNKDSKKPYGKAGEEVTLIIDKGEVLIVENIRGVMFSVRKEEVQ